MMMMIITWLVGKSFIIEPIDPNHKRSNTKINRLGGLKVGHHFLPFTNPKNYAAKNVYW